MFILISVYIFLNKNDLVNIRGKRTVLGQTLSDVSYLMKNKSKIGTREITDGDVGLTFRSCYSFMKRSIGLSWSGTVLAGLQVSMRALLWDWVGEPLFYDVSNVCVVYRLRFGVNTMNESG